MVVNINVLLSTNEAEIRAIARELETIKLKLRKPNSPKVLDTLEARISELQTSGRRLLKQRELLKTKLDSRKGEVIPLNQKRRTDLPRRATRFA